MPALDYVSIIRSVYGDRGVMLTGALASASVAVISALKAQAPILFVVAAALLLVGLIRYANMKAFQAAGIGDDDAGAAEHWENRALLGGTVVAFTHGIWCLVAILVVRDPFAELASCTLTIASTVGMVARNFGLDRLLTLQTVALSVPLWIAMLLRGDPYHQILAVMLIMLLISFRKLAGDIRGLLLAAVHGKADVARLASELDLAISTLGHGLCMLDEAGTVTLINAQAQSAFANCGIHAPKGKSVYSILDHLTALGQAPEEAAKELGHLVSSRQAGKVRLCPTPGRHIEVTVSTRPSRTVLLFEDITERVAVEERATFMARRDALTGLSNRSHFGELALSELRRRAGEDLPSALMVVDVDEFKHVNDSFGHVAGDELLRQVAQRLLDALPEDAIVGRLGGDEFIALLPGAPEDADPHPAGEAVIAAFQTPFGLNELLLPANASVGLVTTQDSSEDLEVLMTKADLALYAAKGAGKGRSQIFHTQMDVDYHSRQKLKADLRQALADDKLSVVFQPLIDMATRRIVSCEALARWTHPELGPVPPATFIPLAEEMGLISKITSCMLRRATEECRRWPGSIGVAVNVSARDFRGLDLEAEVDEALAKSGLSPQRLEIEVTETAVIEERELANSLLTRLAARGITISLDDFGTGYSSLSYLSALPFNKLKVDRSFVEHITADANALRLLANVARLGRDLDLTVVAEGVETEAQLTLLQEQTSVQQLQGYLFSRPLGARDIAELITRFNSGRGGETAQQLPEVVNGG